MTQKIHGLIVVWISCDKWFLTGCSNLFPKYVKYSSGFFNSCVSLNIVKYRLDKNQSRYDWIKWINFLHYTIFLFLFLSWVSYVLVHYTSFFCFFCIMSVLYFIFFSSVHLIGEPPIITISFIGPHCIDSIHCVKSLGLSLAFHNILMDWDFFLMCKNSFVILQCS